MKVVNDFPSNLLLFAGEHVRLQMPPKTFRPASEKPLTG